MMNTADMRLATAFQQIAEAMKADYPPAWVTVLAIVAAVGIVVVGSTMGVLLR